RHRASPSVRPRPTPVTRAVSASTTVPAWDTRPLPSADTAILARRAILFTWKVPLLGADRTFSKPYPPRPKALSTHTTRRRGHPAEGRGRGQWGCGVSRRSHRGVGGSRGAPPRA